MTQDRWIPVEERLPKEEVFEGKTDLKTAEDEFLQALEDVARANIPDYKLTYYGTKEALEKFKGVIPSEMEVHEIPSVVSKVPNEDMFLVMRSR